MTKSKYNEIISITAFLSLIICIIFFIYVFLILLKLAAQQLSEMYLEAALVLITSAPFVIFPTCATLYNFIYYLRHKEIVSKTIRLNEAMRLLHADTLKLGQAVISQYNIRVYETQTDLSRDVHENILCKEVSYFSTFFAFSSDRFRAFNSAYFCCNYDEIQKIIQQEQVKWGVQSAENDLLKFENEKLQASLNLLQEENKKLINERNVALGREELQVKEVSKLKTHMLIFIKLTCQFFQNNENMKPLTKNQILNLYSNEFQKCVENKELQATEEIKPSEDSINEFRKALPKEFINWGGAPKQA